MVWGWGIAFIRNKMLLVADDFCATEVTSMRLNCGSGLNIIAIFTIEQKSAVEGQYSVG